MVQPPDHVTLPVLPLRAILNPNKLHLDDRSLVIKCDQNSAHCQVPCGIYDDPARFQGLLEDTKTIDKAIKSIADLSGKQDAESLNQLTRWINTKEDHASHIIKVVSEYFLTQKVKPVAAAYFDMPK